MEQAFCNRCGTQLDGLPRCPDAGPRPTSHRRPRSPIPPTGSSRLGHPGSRILPFRNSLHRRLGAGPLAVRLGAGSCGSAVPATRVGAGPIGSAVPAAWVGAESFRSAAALAVRLGAGLLGSAALTVCLGPGFFGSAVITARVGAGSFGSAALAIRVGAGSFGSAVPAVRVGAGSSCLAAALRRPLRQDPSASAAALAVRLAAKSL